jgi:hypothetical protein
MAALSAFGTLAFGPMRAAQLTDLIACVAMVVGPAPFGLAQGVDMVLERGFLSDVTVPISDLSRRSLEYPRMQLSQTQDMDFSARVANMGLDTAADVVISVEIILNGTSQGTYASDTVPFWLPGSVDTVAIDANLDIYDQGDAQLIYTASSSTPDLAPENNEDTLVMEFSLDILSRAIGPYDGSIDNGEDAYIVAARFEITEPPDASCAISCVVPYSADLVGSVMGGYLFDETLNEISYGEGYLDTYNMSEPGEEDQVFIWLDELDLSVGADYYAGIEVYGGPDTITIATKGASSDSSALFFDYVMGTWSLLNNMPMLSLIVSNSKGWCVGGIEDHGSLSINNVSIVPNPCWSHATIQYELERSGQVRSFLTNALGQQIQTTAIERKAPGLHSEMINALYLPAGVYSYTLTVEGEHVSRRIVVTH